jgi:hypothetical protein
MTESNLLTLVKPWSTLVITSKTKSTITSDPLNQVHTPWSKLCQRSSQNPDQTPVVLKPLLGLLLRSPNFT